MSKKNKKTQENESLNLKENGIDPGWAADEWKEVAFNDRRLIRRFFRIVDHLAAQPTAPINQACEGWSATKAAYRFFDNEKVTPEKIFKPHQKKTLERMESQEVALCLQDTTTITYHNHTKTEGLGSIGVVGDVENRGLIMHSSMAMTPNGQPLGLLHQKIWARKKRPGNPGKEEVANLPIEEKESIKWIETIREINPLIPEGVEAVHVGDREADMFEFFVEAEKLNAKYLVRATHDRRLKCEGNLKFREFMKTRNIACHMSIEIPERGGQPARKALVAIRFSEVTFTPPEKKGLKFKPISAHGILVEEVNSPADVTPLEWLLVTNTSVNCPEDAMERILWYRIRWNIEIFHKVLKSGCTVEKCRLQTAKRLTRYLTLSSIIAWRLFWLSLLNRHRPDEKCTAVLAEHEWQALYSKIYNSPKLPAQIPTIRQVIGWIAQLGGFLGRECDRLPGVTVIWRGWQRLSDIAPTWKAALHYARTYG